MRLGRSKEEKAAASTARDEFEQFLALLGTGSPGQVRSAATRLTGRAGLLSRRDRERIEERAVHTYEQAILADDVVNAEEEEAFGEVCDAVGVDDDAWNIKYRDVVFRLAIAKLNDGRLDAVGTPHIMTKKNEAVHLEMLASLMKEVVKREFRGGTSGVSFPIGGGVRYRVGSFRGRSVVVGTEMQVADAGPLAVTSSRIVFLGSRKTLDIPLTKLVGLDVFDDGLRLHASNRQNAPLFRLENGHVVAATINAAAQRLDA